MFITEAMPALQGRPIEWSLQFSVRAWCTKTQSRTAKTTSPGWVHQQRKGSVQSCILCGVAVRTPLVHVLRSCIGHSPLSS